MLHLPKEWECCLRKMTPCFYTDNHGIRDDNDLVISHGKLCLHVYNWKNHCTRGMSDKSRQIRDFLDTLNLSPGLIPREIGQAEITRDHPMPF